MSRYATTAFDQFKRESLRKLREFEDKSPKGSVDAPIVDLIRAINEHPHYVTSSSCSGRIALFCGVGAGGDESGGDHHVITKGGKWLVAEHATVTLPQVRAALALAAQPAPEQEHPLNSQRLVLFKHEPFILHVVCRDVDAAQALLQCGLACGFRESGIVVGNKKIMCAIRTTANAMEIPLGRSPAELLVDDAYLAWIVDVANEKFEVNRRRTDQFSAAFRARLVDAPAVAAAPHRRSSVTLRATRALDQDGAPLQRLGHTALAFDDDALFVFGGQGQTSSGTASRLADIVCVASDGRVTAVDAAGETPAARMHHSAVRIQDEMVIFGGRAGPMKSFNDVHAFNVRTRTWRVVHTEGEAPAPRWKHVSLAVGSVLYVHGGRDATSVFDDLFALDMSDSTPSWRRLEAGSSHLQRFDHVAGVVDGRRLVFWGGLESLEDTGAVDASVCVIFDTTTQQWTETPIKNATAGPPLGLVAAAACVVDDLHLVVCGGTSAHAAASTSGASRSASTELRALNTSTMEWQSLGVVSVDSDAPVALVNATCSWLPSRSALRCVGGGVQCFGFGQCYSTPVDCELVVVDKTSKGPAPQPRLQTSTATADEDQRSPSNNIESPATSQALGVLAEKREVKSVKTLLERLNVYDKTRRVHVVPSRDGHFLLPVTAAFVSSRAAHAELAALELVADEDAYANKFGKAVGANRNDTICATIKRFAQQHALPAALLTAIPERYEFVGDVLLVPRDTFVEAAWAPFADAMWAAVCSASTPRLSRVARKAFIDPGEKRQSHVELLYVDTAALAASTFTHRPEVPGWVQVRENGITYGWDLTRVMFSSGNVTEKARMAKIGCHGETIVDLFCGIGYYVLPFLVHGGAAHVHACEWNPDSVAALRFNLERNHVAHKCTVYEGDNQKSAPTIGAVADRVNLGLLPTSEKAWPLAVQVLKPAGGWMHVHDNVATEDRERWEKHVVDSISALAEAHGRRWRVSCEHVERVKSYAPKVYHLRLQYSQVVETLREQVSEFRTILKSSESRVPKGFPIQKIAVSRMHAPNGVSTIRIEFLCPAFVDQEAILGRFLQNLQRSNAIDRRIEVISTPNTTEGDKKPSIVESYDQPSVNYMYANGHGSFQFLRDPSLHGNKGTKFVFYKDEYLTQSEVNAVVEAYKEIYSYPNDEAIQQLQSLGIDVFEPSDSEDSLNWDSLAGYDDVKLEIEDTVVLALQNPDLYDQIARKTRCRYESNRPRAVLFEGPPGTGKTLSARIIAQQAGIPMIHIPIESVVSKWYGDSEKKMSAIFDACEKFDVMQSNSLPTTLVN
ncbi:hypothetical protein ATCC90586_005203 [Pythium insidiosum]|nr:hypothetical protein ATCC90586_005203 [Pythium insidiosum]